MTTEINFWIMPNAGFSTRPLLQAHLDEFERRYPGVKVNLTIHPWSLAWNRFIDVIKGQYDGPVPDVIQVGTTWVPTLAHLGALEKVPSVDVLPQDGSMSAYIWDPGHPNETGQEFYCVPWFIDVRVLYYRQDLFRQLGLRRETLGDWHGFHTACSAISDYIKRMGSSTKILAPLAIAGQRPGVLMHDLAPWVWAAGGDFCSTNLREATLTQNSFFKGSEFYFNLINQGFMPILETGLSAGNFFTGQYAMQFSGSWPLDTYLNPACSFADPDVVKGFDVALFPAGPQGRFTFLGGSNLSVVSAGSNKHVAWDFIRFMTDPQRQQKHARAIGAVPARLSGMDELFARYPGPRQVFTDSFSHARRLPRLIELGSVERIVFEMNERVLDAIRHKQYNPKKLREEIAVANADINAVLSIHGYGGKPVRGAL